MKQTRQKVRIMNKEEIKTVLENDAGIKECFERTLDNNWFNFVSMRDYMNYQKDELLDKIRVEIESLERFEIRGRSNTLG